MVGAVEFALAFMLTGQVSDQSSNRDVFILARQPDPSDIPDVCTSKKVNLFSLNH